MLFRQLRALHEWTTASGIGGWRPERSEWADCVEKVGPGEPGGQREIETNYNIPCRFALIHKVRDGCQQSVFQHNPPKSVISEAMNYPRFPPVSFLGISRSEREKCEWHGDRSGIAVE
jgi:hypothetical protein